MADAQNNAIEFETGEMPTLAASAATRLAGSILARLGGPHARTGGSVIRPDALWKQVSRRLGVVPQDEPLQPVAGRAPLGRFHAASPEEETHDPFSIFSPEKSSMVHTHAPEPSPARILPRITPVPLAQTAPRPTTAAQPAAGDHSPPIQMGNAAPPHSTTVSPQPQVTPDLPQASANITAHLPAATTGPVPGHLFAGPTAPAEISPPLLPPAKQIRVEVEPPPPITVQAPLVRPEPLIQVPASPAEPGKRGPTYEAQAYVEPRAPRPPRPLSETVLRQLAAEVNPELVPATDMLSRMVRRTASDIDRPTPVTPQVTETQPSLEQISARPLRTTVTNRDQTPSTRHFDSADASVATGDERSDAVERAEGPTQEPQRGPIARFLHRITAALPDPVRNFFGADRSGIDEATPGEKYVPKVVEESASATQSLASLAPTVDPMPTLQRSLASGEPTAPAIHAAGEPSQTREQLKHDVQAHYPAVSSPQSERQSEVERSTAELSGGRKVAVSETPSSVDRVEAAEASTIRRTEVPRVPPFESAPLERTRLGPVGSFFSKLLGSDDGTDEGATPPHRPLEMPWARRSEGSRSRDPQPTRELPGPTIVQRASSEGPPQPHLSADTAPMSSAQTQSPAESQVTPLNEPELLNERAPVAQPSTTGVAQVTSIGTTPPVERPESVVQAGASPELPPVLEIPHIQRKAEPADVEDNSSIDAPASSTSPREYDSQPPVTANTQAFHHSDELHSDLAEGAPDQINIQPAVAVALPVDLNSPIEAWQTFTQFSAEVAQAHTPITALPSPSPPVQRSFDAEILEKYQLTDDSSVLGEYDAFGNPVHQVGAERPPMIMAQGSQSNAPARDHFALPEVPSAPQALGQQGPAAGALLSITPPTNANTRPLYARIAEQFNLGESSAQPALGGSISPFEQPRSVSWRDLPPTSPNVDAAAPPSPSYAHRAPRFSPTALVPDDTSNETFIQSPLPVMRSVADMAPRLASLGEPQNIIDSDAPYHVGSVGETPWMETLRTLYGEPDRSDLPLAIPYGAFALPQAETAPRDSWLADFVSPDTAEDAAPTGFASIAMPVPSVPTRPSRAGSSYSGLSSQPAFTPAAPALESASRSEDPAPAYFTSPSYNSSYADADGGETGAWADVIADAALDTGVAAPALALAGEERGGGSASTSQDDQRSEDAQSEAPAADLDDLAESVYVILRRRLAIERERDFA
jgi:hypothetical protein